MIGQPFEMLPWQPETLESVKARFSAALTPDVDVRKALTDLKTSPAASRKHVFDIADYRMRMVVSTDVEDDVRAIHLSFSARPDTLIPDVDTFIKTASKLAAELVGGRCLVYEVTTPKALHLFFDPQEA